MFDFYIIQDLEVCFLIPTIMIIQNDDGTTFSEVSFLFWTIGCA